MSSGYTVCCTRCGCPVEMGGVCLNRECPFFGEANVTIKEERSIPCWKCGDEISNFNRRGDLCNACYRSVQNSMCKDPLDMRALESPPAPPPVKEKVSSIKKLYMYRQKNNK